MAFLDKIKTVKITRNTIRSPYHVSVLEDKFFKSVRKLLSCFYTDYLENQQNLENAEPGTNLQKQILQFQEEYLCGIVNTESTINNVLCK